MFNFNAFLLHEKFGFLFLHQSEDQNGGNLAQVLVNTLSWERTVVVELPLSENKLVKEENKQVSMQKVGSDCTLGEEC